MKKIENILAELILIFGTLDETLVPKDSLRRYKKLLKWANNNCCKDKGVENE